LSVVIIWFEGREVKDVSVMQIEHQDSNPGNRAERSKYQKGREAITSQGSGAVISGREVITWQGSGNVTSGKEEAAKQ